MLIAPKTQNYPPHADGTPDWRSHLISVSQLTRTDLDTLIFPKAKRMQHLVNEVGKVGFLSGKFLTCLFYQPSTRTMNSFIAAIERLGGSTSQISEVKFSSISKGESFKDTIRTLAGYGDLIVSRHPEVGMAKLAASVSPVPIINAGDGTGEHPTQAVLDLFTILRELRRLDGLTVTLVGDLKNGRTVHSLSRLLTLYQGVKLNFVSPPSLRMPPELIARLRGQGVQPLEHDRFDEVVPESDVIYMTRVQKEHMTEEEQAMSNPFVVTEATMAMAKPKGQMILMHPLPRVGEIADEVDDDPRAAYFRQSEYGMYARMALLCLMLRGE